MSRAFKSIDNQITNCGDYTEALRRKTMYLSIMRKVKTAEGAASIAKYDSDVNIKWCQDGNAWSATTPTATLKSTINYKTLIDISKGKRQANPVLNGSTASKFNIFTGNFAMVHGTQPFPIIIPFEWDKTNASGATSQNTNMPLVNTNTSNIIANTITFPNNSQIIGPMDASWNENGYPGWWFDPYGILTEGNCIQTQASNLGVKLVNQVEIVYRWSNAYWRSVAGQSMSGFAFPQSVNFSLQPTNFNDILTQKYGPLPTTDALKNGSPSLNRINAQQELQLEEWCLQQGGRKEVAINF